MVGETAQLHDQEEEGLGEQRKKIKEKKKRRREEQEEEEVGRGSREKMTG